jgi:hypothetical protein
MALFKKTPKSISVAKPPPLGKGRKLQSNNSISKTLELLDSLLASYREPRYGEMPGFVYPGWEWIDSAGPAPDCVISFDDDRDLFMLLCLWTDGSGMQAGMFPLGGGEDPMMIPMIGHWKQRDSSLSSIGNFPPGSVFLSPPIVNNAYVEEIISTAGCQVSARNVELTSEQIHKMFCIKAHQFIASEDPGLADRFVSSHSWFMGADISNAQGVLDDLCQWNFGVLPYVQDLPMRVRRIIFEVPADQGFLGTLER